MHTFSYVSSLVVLSFYVAAADVLEQVGRIYLPDNFGIGGTESIAIDTSNSLIFSTNGAQLSVDVISFKASTKKIEKGKIPMTLTASIDVQSAIDEVFDGITAGDVTSAKYIASRGSVAVAIVPTNLAEQVGFLLLIDADSLEVEDVLELTDCFLPDHVTCTSDGTIIIACEGEPDDNEAQYPAVNPPGSVAMVDADNNVFNVNFNEFNEGGSKSLPTDIYQPYRDQSFTVNVEPEYSVVDGDDQFAYITLQENNAIAVLDIKAKEILEIFSLGSIDFSASGLDASDKDDAINIVPYPNLRGLRMPDSIDWLRTDEGRELIVTANEGDSKDFDESRVKSVVLDPEAFTGFDIGALQSDEKLGRLKIINQLGINAETEKFEELYAISSRDFTIWEVIKDGDSGAVTDLTLVYSSLDQFEQITASVLGADGFNSGYYNPSGDKRSDNKGPEVEGVVFGRCSIGSNGDGSGSSSSSSSNSGSSDDSDGIDGGDSKVFSFTALERTGGIMVYDVTDLDDVHFVQYLNNRDFSVTFEEDVRPPEEAGDTAPEQIVYIDEDAYGTPLLFAAFSESSSIAIYAVNCE